MNRKTLPFSEEAEKAFLGACLLDATSTIPLAHDAKLEPEDFWIPAHATIWEAIQSLSEHGASIDVISLQEQLKRNRKLDQVGGAIALDDLVDACVTATHAGHYLSIIGTKSRLRKIYRACQEAQHAVLQDGEEDPEKIINKTQEALFRCSSADDVCLSPGEAANVLMRRFKDAKAGVKPGLESFLTHANEFMGCFKYAGLYFVAAEPALGKTTYIQQELKHWAMKDIPVAGISLEMRLEDFFGRILCEDADVSMFALEQGYDDPPEATVSRIGKFRNACSRWIDEHGQSQYPLFMTDKRMNVVEACSWIRMMHKRHGIKAVGIDYLQLLNPPSSSKNLNSGAERLAYVVNMLRDLAKELNIVILVMAQIDKQSRKDARGQGNNGRQKPGPSAIRGASEVEDVAWGIVMMYKWPDPETGMEHIYWDLVKHRSGALGTIDLNFIRNRQRMESLGRVEV